MKVHFSVSEVWCISVSCRCLLENYTSYIMRLNDIKHQYFSLYVRWIIGFKLLFLPREDTFYLLIHT